MSLIEKSEILFQRYCGLRGYGCNRIPAGTQQGVRSPDFEILVNGTKIIAEVKELQANEEDIRSNREFQNGAVVVFGREPGLRARYLIKNARSQLRASAKAGIPCVVVLFDNILVDGRRPPGPPIDLFGPLGPNDIDFAMHGLQQANVRIRQDGRTESLGDTRNHRRKITNREYISAVSVLYENSENGDLFMITHHNFGALIPLPRFVFDGAGDFHLAKPANPEGSLEPWQRI